MQNTELQNRRRRKMRHMYNITKLHRETFTKQKKTEDVIARPGEIWG